MIEEILHSHPGLRQVASNPEKFRLQIVLGLLENGSDGQARLQQHGYRLGAEYFYPASSVKLFAAIAALEHLEVLRRESGFPLSTETPLTFHPLFPGETMEDQDPSHLANGKITVGQEIRKLFLVSDNEAFNRLYELVGQDRLAASLRRAGLGEARIVHRLSERRTVEENRSTPRIDFAPSAASSYTQEARISAPLAAPVQVFGLEVGKRFWAEGELIHHPFDFSTKNHFPLADLQRGLCMVTQPRADCVGDGFSLREVDHNFLLEPLHLFPGQSTDPVFNSREYPDHWVKFLLPGLARVIPKERLRIYNKIGRAYGFSTENSWVVDTETGRSFFLAATLYTNENSTLNDDDYQYEPFADDFLADLGEAVARHLWE
ncbi:MAG: class A beta-lactamase-related serine hydrolase [Deltaproteobacteria bacterium]|nr:class A beta-lactamase-related serine hydrolase [Deltaproteobacteria bacterium]